MIRTSQLNVTEVTHARDRAWYWPEVNIVMNERKWIFLLPRTHENMRVLLDKSNQKGGNIGPLFTSIYTL